MKKDEARNKNKFHLKRYNYYKKKEEEAKTAEKRIGFKFKRDQ